MNNNWQQNEKKKKHGGGGGGGEHVDASTVCPVVRKQLTQEVG